MPLVAIAMTREGLMELLEKITNLVDDGDCTTGFIEWGEGVDVDNPDSAKNILVKAIYITPNGRQEIGNPEL